MTQISELEAQVALLQRQVGLDLAKMANMAEGLRDAKEFMKERMSKPVPHGVIQRIDKALDSAPDLLWSGRVELHKGMLCGYTGPPDERIQAPDQIVMVHVTGFKTGGDDDTEDGALTD